MNERAGERLPGASLLPVTALQRGAARGRGRHEPRQAPRRAQTQRRGQDLRCAAAACAGGGFQSRGRGPPWGSWDRRDGLGKAAVPFPSASEAADAQTVAKGGPLEPLCGRGRGAEPPESGRPHHTRVRYGWLVWQLALRLSAPAGDLWVTRFWPPRSFFGPLGSSGRLESVPTFSPLCAV